MKKKQKIPWPPPVFEDDGLDTWPQPTTGWQKRGPSPIDVFALRTQMNLSQKQFAKRFGFSVGALRHWERGERKPRGPALALLNVIKRNPRAVLVALRQPIKGPCPICDDDEASRRPRRAFLFVD